MHVTPELVLAAIGTLISIASILYAYANSGKKMENRLTKLEASQLTVEDRRCLYDLDTKMSTIWKFFERDLPSALHSAHTPDLDRLLDKAKDGIGQMTIDEVRALYKLVNNEIENEKPQTDNLRVITLGLYRSFLKHEMSALNILI